MVNHFCGSYFPINYLKSIVNLSPFNKLYYLFLKKLCCLKFLQGLFLELAGILLLAFIPTRLKKKPCRISSK
jgi:hypothetical protein